MGGAKGFWAAQSGHVCPVIPPKSANAAVVGTRFNMASWAHASVILSLGAAGGPIGAITVNVYQAQAGGAGVAIPYRLFKAENATAPYDVLALNAATNDGVFPQTAAGYVPTADEANAFYVIEIDAANLLQANNGTYVELDIAAGSLATTAQLLSALAILSAGRQTGDADGTVTAQV